MQTIIQVLVCLLVFGYAGYMLLLQVEKHHARRPGRQLIVARKEKREMALIAHAIFVTVPDPITEIDYILHSEDGYECRVTKETYEFVKIGDPAYSLNWHKI